MSLHGGMEFIPNGRASAAVDRTAALCGEGVGMAVAKLTRADLTVLRDLLQAGKVTPVVDRTYPLAGAAEAIRYLETGHARGKIVITM